MKRLFLLTMLCLSFNAMAAKSTVKSCVSYVPNFEDDGRSKIAMNVNIYTQDGQLKGGVETTKSDIHVENATVEEFSIRDNILTLDSYSEEFSTVNNGEMLIAHAHAIETSELGQVMKSGIALKKVKKVKVFLVGGTSKFGQLSVVEAYDKDGNDIGSFLGGFFVSPCLPTKY